MNSLNKLLVIGAGLVVTMVTIAQVPAGAPAGTTGLCKDGSYYNGATKKGACRGHKGVKDWYGDTTATAEPATTHASVAAKKAATTNVATVTSAAKPSGSTGLCNDGTYYSGATKKGACRGHKGVKDWYGDAAASASAATSATVAPPITAVPVQPAQKITPTKSNSTPPVNAAPGGGNGQVWVNTSSKTYHCPADKWYGKTKSGEYMSEQDAKAKGYHPDHGKVCK